ncbi:hypothetical protein [Aureibaculum luteum]|uniref:hypothetical protein n=1 Tax=Aureibaculum luteum TaxID=1548456 RepID=UPI000E523419|nr:hypothetical protein [Aureibaculum luteum]
MKNKHLKNTSIIIVILLIFFLGRESKQVKSVYESQPTYLKDSFEDDSKHEVDGIFNTIQEESNSDIVYRCGQSKIYHPTTSHASFKRCKSKVYELTVERAKELGMRHCKCRH